MADRDLNLIVLPQGGSGLAPRPPVDDDLPFACQLCGRRFGDVGAAAHCLCLATGGNDCPPCEDQERTLALVAEMRAAVIEMRRGLVSFERGLAALLKVVDVEDLT